MKRGFLLSSNATKKKKVEPPGPQPEEPAAGARAPKPGEIKINGIFIETNPGMADPDRKQKAYNHGDPLRIGPWVPGLKIYCTAEQRNYAMLREKYCIEMEKKYHLKDLYPCLSRVSDKNLEEVTDIYLGEDTFAIGSRKKKITFDCYSHKAVTFELDI